MSTVMRRPTPALVVRRPASQKAPTETGRGLLRRNWPLVMIVGAIVVVNLLGLEYYLKPIEERVRDPQHAWLKRA